MNKKLTTAVALAAALMGAQSAHAGLNGDSITGSLTANPSNWGMVTQQFSPTAVVGSGVEFNGQYANGGNYIAAMWWDIGVDVANTTFTITADALPAGYNNIYAYTSPLFTVHLGNLNAGAPITGVSLLSGLATVGSYDVFTTSNTADSIDITFYSRPCKTLTPRINKGNSPEFPTPESRRN